MKSLIILFTFSITQSVVAQMSIDEVLKSVQENNTQLKVQVQNESTQTASFNIGRELYNPDISVDYFVGSPSTAGNQTDIAISQPFDFPSTYKHKRNLFESQSAGTSIQTQIQKRDLMQQVKSICVELVYHEKLKNQLIQQKENIASILENFEQKLLKGDGNGLDVSKAKLQLMQVTSDIQEEITTINHLNQELTTLNGGKEIAFSDTSYFTNSNIPPLENLIQTAQSTNPTYNLNNQRQLIAQNQLTWSKSNSLPSFEAGYHYQGILGQTFHGVHFGFSIPLWENKNQIKYSKENILLSELNTMDYDNHFTSEMKREYQTFENYKDMLTQYNDFFSTAKNLDLLKKALDFGELKAIEYFNEVNFYNEFKIRYLKTEKDMHLTLVYLTKYE